MNKPLVINLVGPPGSGKSTGAAQIFCNLKQLGINCELVTEFAKDKTWEQNKKAIACAEYIFGNQSYRLFSCKDDVDVIITDSPLPLSIIYNYNKAIEESYANLVIDVFNTYNNINFYINRVKPYNPKGRNQTETESNEIGQKIKALYEKFDIPIKTVTGDNFGYKFIVKEVLSILGMEDTNV